MIKADRMAAVLAAALLITGAAAAQPASTAPDYRDPANWLCRPGDTDGACDVELDAVGVSADGSNRIVRFEPAREPEIDCFYVYPTVSADPGPLSDLQAGPEERRAVRGQFARLAAQCRLFAPVYRQVSLAGLQMNLRGGGLAEGVDWNIPYEDVRTAFRDYMARDNGGRGVVLIGHSQGALMLERLLREEIDGKPTQRRLVAAYLAGHTGFAVPQGRDAGGSLPTIPLCRRDSQTGCVLVWASYRADDASDARFFGRATRPGMVPACVNPAAVAGGQAVLRGYFSRPASAPADAPPFVENTSGVLGECVTEAQGSVLRVSVQPDAVTAPTLNAALRNAEPRAGWGLHLIDVNLVMGNIVDLVGRQAAAWGAAETARRP